jgi:hypothetical protein
MTRANASARWIRSYLRAGGREDLASPVIPEAWQWGQSGRGKPLQIRFFIWVVGVVLFLARLIQAHVNALFPLNKAQLG